MSEIVIAAYRPHEGKQDALLEVVREHFTVLRAEELVTERAPIVMRSRIDGTIVEVFEWRSAEAVEAAHTNERVLEMWRRFSAVADYVGMASLSECEQPFPHFDPVEIGNTLSAAFQSI